MSIEFLYWEPSHSAVAGHTALRIDNETCSFWPIIVNPDTTHGPVSGNIITNEALEKFAPALCKLALPTLQQRGMYLPFGIQPFHIIYDHFEAIKTTSLENLSNFFTAIDPDQMILGNQRQTVIDTSVILAQWIKETEYSKSDIINIGNPTDVLDLSFLDEIAIKNRLLALQTLGNNLSWFAKVGAVTDTALNNGAKIRLPLKFLKKVSGLRYYEAEKIRHNCASFILDLLKAGGLENYTSNFDEKRRVSAALQQAIQFSAESKNKTPTNAQLAAAASIDRFHKPLRLLGYGRNPITDWFGTLPTVLHAMVLAAVKQNDSAKR
jgi:hypothetical protein